MEKINNKYIYVVDVAQGLERRIVDPEVEGSNPFIHPILVFIVIFNLFGVLLLQRHFSYSG